MPFILLAIIAIIIGTATIVESFTGTQFAHDNIYGALWMKILWGTMAIASIWQIIKRKLWSRFGIFLLHASFLIILTGALLTSLFAERGNMHLREGFAESAFTDKSNKVIRLPFLVQLDSFAIEHYPGTNVPSDYISHISIQSTDSKEYVSGKISMNNILKHNGYRFYLTSFDEDGKGTWFIVNHDPWGIATTYSGYLLLMLSAISILFSRKGKLPSTLKQALRSKCLIGILATAILILIIITVQHTTYISETAISTVRQQTESLYHSIPYSKILFIFNLTFGIILLATSLYFPQAHRRISVHAKAAIYVSTIFTAIIYIIRWYIGGRIPLANGHETMLFMALVTLVTSSILCRRTPSIIPFGLIISGLTLLVSHLAQMSTSIDNLMPVLQSPLLSIHVSVIMIAYTLFAFMALNGVSALILSRKSSGQEQAHRLTTISRTMLYPATFLLAIGIFIGAIWANISWGNYWSWDPKEAWALITMIVYGIAFHNTSIPWLRSDRIFNIYIALAFLTVLMTYFGVNYLLGGMHSYANV